MYGKIPGIILLLCVTYCKALSQSQNQQGLICKAGTDLRLGSVQVQNKRSGALVKSNLYGVYKIPALPGDTLLISCDGYNNTSFTVSSFADNICFLKSATTLSEVVIKETTVSADLDEVKRGYRCKSVFYTGTPHYYYLVLKPMTFIYENFKSEVINARKFNRHAKNELDHYEIAGRFNDLSIKSAVAIKDNELETFKELYWPQPKQIRSWNDYDLAQYIIRSYQDFKNILSAKKM